MYYRDPIDVWREGRMALFDDAAHPMVPFLAADAGQAIDDAVVACRALLRAGFDPASICLSGESAGGGLAIALVPPLISRRSFCRPRRQRRRSSPWRTPGATC